MSAPTYRNGYISEVRSDGTVVLTVDVDYLTSHELVYNREQRICVLDGTPLEALNDGEKAVLMGMIGSWTEWKQALPQLIAARRAWDTTYAQQVRRRTHHDTWDWDETTQERF